MLKSTHRTVKATEEALPEGWTAHKAPSGHTYYYNASTKQSTYTRPEKQVDQPIQIDYNATQPEAVDTAQQSSGSYPTGFSQDPNGTRGQGVFTGGRSYQDRSRQQQKDRPKSKKPILNCEPWVLVMTKMKRRFVYNTKTNESFWKFPQDVMLAVIEMERVEREEKERGEAIEEQNRNGEGRDTPTVTASPWPLQTPAEDEDSDEYEEVEVTDDEDEEGIEDPASKRPRTEEPPPGPVEFNEDDIAYQLAQMGEEYGLDPGEYDNPDAEGDYIEGEEGLPLTEEDSEALFRDLLDDFKINPYTTFDKLVDDGHIINDDRYTVLPNMARRKGVFTAWSTDRIQELQIKKVKEAEDKKRKDPRVAYLNYLYDRASLKLYWPEFRRKYKKDEAMRDSSYPDKEREKLYREYTARLKMSESDRKEDLAKLLKDASKKRQIHRESTVDTLPNEVLRDVKFHAMPSALRDEVLEDLLVKLPPPSGDEAAQTELAKQRDDRRRREEALAERRRRVEEEKRKTFGAVRHGREMLRDEAEQMERAKMVGRDSLMSYMEDRS
jgi:WW domain/FF domain